MANTIVTHVSDGVTVLYPITFTLGYIEKEQVYVYTGEDADYETQLSYFWVNDTQIQLFEPEPNQTEIKIRRVVPRNVLVNVYQNGGLIPEEDLNNSFLQTLMILEEADDGFTNFAQQTEIDMNFNRIINLGAPVNAEDAVRLTDVEGIVVGQVPPASETVAGTVERATSLEAATGTDTERFINSVDMHNVIEQLNTESAILGKLLTVDGAGSGLDADKLDGQHGDYFVNASNLATGTISTARLPAADTSNRGIVELATSGESAAGVVNNKADTPFSAWQGGAERSVFAQSGLHKLHGGLGVQWGYATAGNPGVTVTFPLAFVAPAYSVLVVQRIPSASGQTDANVCIAGTPTKSSFVSYFPGVTQNVFWIATGDLA